MATALRTAIHAFEFLTPVGTNQILDRTYGLGASKNVGRDRGDRDHAPPPPLFLARHPRASGPFPGRWDHSKHPVSRRGREPDSRGFRSVVGPFSLFRNAASRRSATRRAVSIELV